MAFRPNMTAFTDGIRPVSPLRWRGWDGVVADLWDAKGEPGGSGHYTAPDPRVVVFLDKGPAPVRLSARPGTPGTGKVAFIPAGQPIWSEVVRGAPFRHLDLHFERGGLVRRLGGGRPALALDRPVLLDAHLQVEQLAGILAAEVATPAHDDVVAASLASAILAMLTGPHPKAEPAPRNGGLTPAQLRRVTDLMEARLHQKLGVADLAEAAGLSESWFAHAFRATVGVSPARHLARLRIEAAQRLLRDTRTSIADIATATGFADQAHLTRAFRSAVGATPAAWRRDVAP